MKNKKGFISMTLVYSFFIVFLFLMLAIISVYKEKNNFMEAIDDQIIKDIAITKSQKSSLLNKLLVDNVSMSYESITNISYPANSILKNGNGLFYIDYSTNSSNSNEILNIIDEDNNGYSSKIYFFRGEVNNNYVVFGRKFTRGSDGYIVESSIKRMCWKIVRTNENGSIRLAYSGIYNGTKCEKDSALIKEKYADSSYVYTYQEGDGITLSNARSTLDEWYKNTNFLYSSNLKYSTCSDPTTCETVKNLQSYMSDAIFCNNNNFPLGSPSFKCQKTENRYSLSQYNFGESTSNTALTYPVGLLTKDDVAYAGGALGAFNAKFYLNYGTDYWTMSPSENTTPNKLYYVTSKGDIQSGNVNNIFALIPVVTIKQSVSVDSGSGYSDDPYILGE